MDEQQRSVYIISVAAELAGMHPQTLRIYERKGLLEPERTGGGSRRYSDIDIARLRRIQELTNAGINLEGVRRIIELEDENDRLRAQVTTEMNAAAVMVAEVHKSYRRDLVPMSTTAIVATKSTLRPNGNANK